MTANQKSFEERVSALKSSGFNATLTGIKRGIEREALRINTDGTLAATPHPKALGSALTHDSITTDFSESLLEFITPPETRTTTTMEQLYDIHKYVHDNIGDEWLWPMSMPCFIDDENDIPLAYFGESNVGKMKRIYRSGLKNRYGSMMQAISGVHYNFSLPEAFWQQWAQMHGKPYSPEQVSADYFALIRNYRRLCWLIPYLYGASPSLCGSFLKNKTHNMDFSVTGKGTYYLPYATSLRMSDLGYTSSEQSSLKICYNTLDNYVRLLRGAMQTPSDRFSQFAAGEGGHYQQLSKNVLQIENELYSPIRPKQPTESMEKPTDALVKRGVSYIEVRALDVDPYSPIGVSETQSHFLDVFLLSCLLMPSKELDETQIAEANDNMRTMVLEGRKPDVTLQRDGQHVAFRDWTATLFEQFRQVASVLDEAHGDQHYQDAVSSEWQKVNDPEMTPSGKILQTLLSENKDNGTLGMELAAEYRDVFDRWHYKHQDAAVFAQAAQTSLDAQKALDAEEQEDFDKFIKDYFTKPPAKKMPD
ncbi:glutamate--cysteine ligase [Alteromonas halophila]|uniref:Glutamate--cysteine ligase n=1 Tax=Alteromonas halophila TaxID=516698 RepID=A0A918MV53_9ALTE|nr:glutamate--cysteine ligase [Alteromonas halophila]GGW74207.1 glutamate--cysteine ligase [Alteromonas halophila]